MTGPLLALSGLIITLLSIILIFRDNKIQTKGQK